MNQIILRNILIMIVLFLAAFSGFGGYQYYLLQTELKNERNNLTNQLNKLNEDLNTAQEEKARLVEELRLQANIVSQFGEQVEDFAGTVSTLEKLSQTDKELLQKYSKIYFLNEHYVPSALIIVDKNYTRDQNKPAQIHTKIWLYLERLMKMAVADGVELKIESGYRSFGIQSDLKSGYKVTYGAGTANQFSADQGYSEHQLGTTLDFTESGLNPPLAGFDKTKAYEWLLANAHKFGFVLSYPKNNTYYQFEPWHWRFVGVKLATTLKEANNFFYDLDQREIDKYLVNIFD